MPIEKFAFHLSPRGKLRWAIASLFLVAQLPQAFAGGVTVAPGPGGTPQLQNQAGVPIVNIVAPNGAGLSHNQFLDYNVDRQGLVLNNALQAGQSQLAGQLAANPQFQGQAASVILNEVISRNASALNGAQEIFGRSADYVLANPNGISVNGGSFINTPNANLVVGRPELNDGKLQGLNTRDATGHLQIQGQGLANREGSINLIAPRIDSQGRIDARDQLNLTVGRNQLDYPSGQVRSVDPAGTTQDSRIDASLFGAMQAGRINIVSTAEGAGVRVGPVQVEGRDGVKIQSAGDLQISGQALPNSLDVTRSAVRSSQGDVTLHGDKDLTLAAADVSGRNVKLDAGRNLTLSSVEARKLQEKRENWNNSTIGITWETYDRTQTDSDSRQHGSQVVASHTAELKAGASTELKAAKVEAGETLKIDSGADLRLTAATETRTQTDQGQHRKHLWKADWNNSSEEQRSVTSQLKAGKNIAISSGELLSSQGAELTSKGDIQLAGKQVEIGSASRTQRSSKNGYSGDLVGGGFFGKTGDADQGKTLNQGSKINADGKLIVKADDVRISGSQVRGRTEASVISDKGSLTIDGVQNTSHSNSHDKDSKFFGITKDESRQNLKGSTTVSSQLSSDSNLALKSAKDIDVVGATVAAGGSLSADAVGKLTVSSAQNTSDSSSSNQNRGFAAYAKENAPGAGQYRAGIHYEDKQQTTTANETRQQSASLTGANVELTAGGDLTLKGANVKATAGDVSLSGQNVALLAEHDSTSSTTDTTRNAGGFYYTGGLDRAGSGVDFAHGSSQDNTAKTTARTTGVESSGKLQINAGNGTLTTQGARVNAGSTLQVTAGQVDNQAANNTDSSSHKESNWSADVGANVEYKGIARPVAKAIEGVAQSKVQQPGLLDNLTQPNVGIDVEVGHSNNSRSEQNSNAVVSQFKGGAVDVQVAGELKDQGSQYRATDGGLTIKADSQVATAAADTHSSSEQSVDAKVGVRVYTTTGEDVNVRGSGAGGSRQTSETSSKAVVGSYAGNQGVKIELRGDGQYEGSQFNGGQGGVAIKSGGDLALNQANDHQSSSTSSLRGDGSLTVGTNPGAEGSNVNLGAGFQLDHKANQTEDSQARVASIQGKGPVQLSSAGDQVLQGTTIGTVVNKATDISLNAGGKLDLQAATDTHSADGSNLGGGLNLGGGRSSTEKSSGLNGNLSANFNIGRVGENGQSLKGGSLNSQGPVLLSSGASAADAIHLQGTQVSAPSVTLDAQQGGIYLESAQSTQVINNWGLTLGAGGNASKSTPSATNDQDVAKSGHGFDARAKIDVDNRTGTTQKNSHIQADSVVLNSAGNTRLAGARIDAKQVSGQVGGDLMVESRQDHESGVKVAIDLRLNAEKNQPGAVGKLAKTTGPLKDKVEGKAQEAFDSHRDKLETAVDKSVEGLASAKDSLTRSGSYSLNEKDSAGTKVADATQSALFGDKSGKTSYTPTLYLDVSHTSKNSVTQASGISGSQGVDLRVGGETQLTGARISAKEGSVDLGGSRVTSTSLSGSDYRADVGLNLSKSAVNLATGAKDELTQTPDAATARDRKFNLGPLSAGGHYETQVVQAGIDEKTL